MPILKANAYGHGLVAVAKKLEQIGAPYVGVAYLGSRRSGDLQGRRRTEHDECA